MIITFIIQSTNDINVVKIYIMQIVFGIGSQVEKLFFWKYVQIMFRCDVDEMLVRLIQEIHNSTQGSLGFRIFSYIYKPKIEGLRLLTITWICTCDRGHGAMHCLPVHHPLPRKIEYYLRSELGGFPQFRWRPARSCWTWEKSSEHAISPKPIKWSSILSP